MQSYWMKFGVLPAEYPMPDAPGRCPHGAFIVKEYPFAWEQQVQEYPIYCICCGSALLYSAAHCITCVVKGS